MKKIITPGPEFCKYNFHTCGNLKYNLCESCDEGDNYEFFQGSETYKNKKMKKTITSGSDFSGVGAFDYAMNRVSEAKEFNHKRIFACDFDKNARITYQHNHGEPVYYPENVYDRQIPEESLDLYMTSPPCQSFSLAGKRKGKDSENGVLFFNSYEFIKVNNPRFFIFENVKGLLSDDNGRTFQEWLNYLGGKSINGLPLLFKDENAIDYHIYYKVLNSKKHGVPQNRERIFIIGIRDDEDNNFTFPKEEYLIKKFKDILENDVDEKHFLKNSEISMFENHKENQIEKGNGFYWKPLTEENISAFSVVTSTGAQGNYLKVNQSNNKIRRLTPRECFRLQDFPDSFDFSVVKPAQAYKQAGNSITVRVLEKILMKLNF